MPRLAEPNATKEQIVQLIKGWKDVEDRESWDECEWEYYTPYIIPEKDFKIRFDFENFEAPWQEGYEVGSDNIVGWYEVNGTTIALCYAGGDWEYPVYFAAYLERGGKRLRAYIPTVGNCFNIYLKAAFGSEEAYFSEEEVKKKMPADLLDEDRLGEWYRYVSETKINLDDMLKDIGARIEGATPVVPFKKKHELFYDAKALDEWLKDKPKDDYIDDYIWLLTDRSKPESDGEYLSRQQCEDLSELLNELKRRRAEDQ